METSSSIELQHFPDRHGPTLLVSPAHGKNEISTSALENNVDVPGNLTESPESAVESQNRQNAIALPPVDGGVQAWTFVASSFVLESLVWGFGFS